MGIHGEKIGQGKVSFLFHIGQVKNCDLSFTQHLLQSQPETLGGAPKDALKVALDLISYQLGFWTFGTAKKMSLVSHLL